MSKLLKNKLLSVCEDGENNIEGRNRFEPLLRTRNDSSSIASLFFSERTLKRQLFFPFCKLSRSRFIKTAVNFYGRYDSVATVRKHEAYEKMD